MIFRVRKSYSITLKRAHNLLGIPKDPPPIIHGHVGQVNSISREQIQEAFRKAAKCYHPDILAASGGVDAAVTTTTTTEQARTRTKIDANRTFRECNEARELLLDYYVNRKYIPPEVIESVKDHPPPIECPRFARSWTFELRPLTSSWSCSDWREHNSKMQNSNLELLEDLTFNSLLVGLVQKSS